MDVQQLLSTALELTRTMTEAARVSDFGRVTNLMQERGEMLSKAVALSGSGLQGGEAAIAQQLREEDTRLLDILKEKRASISRQLETLRAERALTAYRL